MLGHLRILRALNPVRVDSFRLKEETNEAWHARATSALETAFSICSCAFAEAVAAADTDKCWSAFGSAFDKAACALGGLTGREATKCRGRGRVALKRSPLVGVALSDLTWDDEDDRVADSKPAPLRPLQALATQLSRLFDLLDRAQT